MTVTYYAAVLDIQDAPDYVIGVLQTGSQNPYPSTYNVDIPQYYYVSPGYTWDGLYFVSPYGEIVNVSPSGVCAVCLKSNGLVVNTIVASPTDPWPDPTQQLVEIRFGTAVTNGFTWNGKNFVGPDGVIV
jgi:hypothetical protein